MFQWSWKNKTENYINVSDDDAFSIGVQKVVAFRVTAENFRNSPLQLGKTGKHVLWKQRYKRNDKVKDHAV